MAFQPPSPSIMPKSMNAGAFSDKAINEYWMTEFYGGFADIAKTPPGLAFEELPAPRQEGACLPSTGYGRWQHQPDVAADKLRHAMYELPKVMEYNRADFVAVTGSSGLLFMGMLMGAGFSKPWVKVRKRGEYSHGEIVEARLGHVYHRGIFVDDMVCSGQTLRRVQDELARISPSVKIVGNFLYGAE